MTWTSLMKRMQPGAKLYVHNIRRPYRSRHVKVVERTKRILTVQDARGDRTLVRLPYASFTRVVDDNEVELLAKGDGPIFDDLKQMVPGTGILAGQPYMVLRIIADVGEQ